MKEKFINRTKVCGYIFNITGSRSWDNLQVAVSGENAKNPGQEYIRGVMNVATDDEGLNVVAVHFTYVVPTYKSGKENPNFTYLKSIIDRAENGTLKTFENAGADAEKVTITGDLSLNEFVNQEGDVIAAKQIRGSFVGPMTARDQMGATFDLEVLLSNATTREVEDGDDYMNVSGYAFNFRNEILPVQFSVHSKGGINYFEGADISSKDPFFGTVSGEVVSNLIVVSREDESDVDGFGEVKPTTRSIRSWDIVRARRTLEFDEEGTLTRAELKGLLGDRAEHEAQLKKDAEERAAKREDGFAAAPKKASATVEDDDDDLFPF